MSKRIAVFNHKGGVSKTTTAYNLGWMIAKNQKRVLLVDADPQCNLTSLFLSDDFDRYYSEDGTKYHNIKDGVKVAFEGKPSPIVYVNCATTPRNRNLFLIPGHQNLSEYDAALTFAQTSNNAIATLQNLPGAFSALLGLTEAYYNVDFTIIDMNPSLSAINQNLFISSHSFIVPTNPDPFSLMAIDTLQRILPRWVSWAKTMQPAFSDAAYPLPNFTPKLIGSIIQRFNIRKGKAAKPYRDNINDIKLSIKNVLAPSLQQSGMLFENSQYNNSRISDDYCLSEIPDFAGLLPKAQNAGVPVFALTDTEINETGPILEGMKGRRDDFFANFKDLSSKITAILKYA
jgi:cellulose biosynthesis protein BcsQ